MKSKKNHALLGIIGCILLIGGLVYLEIFHKENIKDLFAPILSLLSVGLMYFTKKLDDISDTINSVRPIWRIIEMNSEVEFFSLNKSNSVLSNVRYYSLIVDEDNNVLTINNAATSEKSTQIYITPNAVVESEKSYGIFKTNTSLNDSKNIDVDSIFPFTTPSEDQKQIIIIESKTIYSEKTYFFEGGTLSGGLTMEYKTYTGEWDSNKKKIAKYYIEQINKQSKIEEPSSTTGTTTTSPTQNKKTL
ncbi:hypothetical protein PS421_01425 [Pediococcus pentosaceus]|uniref:hypothetical protein n=1 Tax=Pediococcus pentosaceus TaxID=1255 RepID=UPI002F25FAB1